MKNFPIIPLILSLCILSSCGGHGHHDHHDEVTITTLDIDQVNKLAPYMFDLQKVGAMESFVDSIRVGDSTMMSQHRNKQSYSFSIMLDEDGHPVMPDSTSTTERRIGGGRHQGNVVVWCLGGCIMVGAQLCLMEGCKPMDNACGCIPPACGVCDDIGCMSIVSGFMSGSLVMQ